MMAQPPRVSEDEVNQDVRSSGVTAKGKRSTTPEDERRQAIARAHDVARSRLRRGDVAAEGRKFDFVQAERERLRRNELDATEIADPADSRIAQLAECPFPSIDEITTGKLVRFKELWHTRHQAVVATMRQGTGLNVDLGTGLYVTGATRLEASDKFRDIFGPERTSLAEEVGIPLSLGSGLWTLPSEE